MPQLFDTQARPTIHELQSLAEEAARPKRRRRRGPSRAARLHLIDMLSRWGGAGLALIAGLTVFSAVSVGRAMPVRAAVWTAMVLVALYVCRRLRRDFRAGDASAARPFRWRADYSSALAVLSTAFGAGALLLSPESAPASPGLQTLSLIFAGTLGAALLHAPHGRAAAALFLPAALFSLAGAWRIGGASLALFGAGAGIALGGAALFLASERLRRIATRRFPRTGFVRRDLTARPTPASAETGIGATLAQ